MKHIFLVCALFAGISFSFAGNGNGDDYPSCNCQSSDKTDIYASGLAEIIGGNTVRCSGETGKCWEVTLKPGGGWVLTIYTDPIITFGNDNSPDNPPASPVISAHGDGYTTYNWDSHVWR